MTTKTSLTTYNWTDWCGNRFTLSIRDGRVLLCNQHRIACCLSTVGFLTTGNGYVEQSQIVRAAALRGLASLRAVTKLDWQG